MPLGTMTSDRSPVMERGGPCAPRLWREPVMIGAVVRVVLEAVAARRDRCAPATDYAIPPWRGLLRRAG
jgi:hypothetical protein